MIATKTPANSKTKSVSFADTQEMSAQTTSTTVLEVPTADVDNVKNGQECPSNEQDEQEVECVRYALYIYIYLLQTYINFWLIRTLILLGSQTMKEKKTRNGF